MSEAKNESSANGANLERLVGRFLQQRLAKFAKRAGFYTANHIGKIAEELDELRATPSDPHEMADIVLAVMLHADTHGVDLLAACQEKFCIVASREYGSHDHRGVVRHTEPRYDDVFYEGVQALDKC